MSLALNGAMLYYLIGLFSIEWFRLMSPLLVFSFAYMWTTIYWTTRNDERRNVRVVTDALDRAAKK